MKGKRMNNKNIIVLSQEEKEDKIECFARINKVNCNALKKKHCHNCSFYKDKSEVPNFKKLLEIKL